MGFLRYKPPKMAINDILAQKTEGIDITLEVLCWVCCLFCIVLGLNELEITLTNTSFTKNLEK